MMRDIGYRCNHCGSFHEVEAIRENLFVDAQPFASYQNSPGSQLRRWLRYRSLVHSVLRALRHAE
jgi:DNA-binding transcriptional regulator YiaG